jgi:hypothetical protein
MSTTSITFRGLCTFIPRGAKYEVYLLPGTGHVNCGHDHPHVTHLPTLSVPIEFIDTDDMATTWMPDAVTYERTGGVRAQIGVWKLDHLEVDVTPRGPVIAQLPRWQDRDKAVDLKANHSAAEAKAKSRAAILAGDAASIDLQDGEIVSEDLTSSGELKLVRNGTAISDGPFARAIRWSLNRPGLRVDLTSRGGRIALLEGAKVAVTNVAPVMASKALCHFEHYYEVFTAKPPSDRLLSLAFGKRDEPVYDCVPPAPGPDPEP